MTTRSCPACGAVVSKRLGRCPSCRAWLGRRLIGVVLAGALMAVIAGWTLIQLRGPRTAAPRVSVEITPGVSRLSADARGTDTSATIDNSNKMPVDVTILVRGLDISNRVVIEKTIGPFHNLAAGETRSIQAYLDATPLDNVTFEAIIVKPVDLDR